MESKVTLKYWPIRGLAQSIRYLLAYSEIDFNDEHYVNRDKWFNEDKPNLKSPFPNIPCLIDEGKVYVESEAILWYVAYKSKKQELVGVNEEQKVQIIQLMGVIKDMLGEAFTFCRTQEGTEENLKNFLAKSITPRFQRLTKHLTDTGSKFLVGDEVSIVDFQLYEALNCVLAMVATVLDSQEVLKKYHQNFKAIPQISGYEASNKFLAKPFLPTTYKYAI